MPSILVKPSILIVDTYYQDFLSTRKVRPERGYKEELQSILDEGFGTADFYSRNLRAIGWDATDVIANHYALQKLWAHDHGVDLKGQTASTLLLNQVEHYKPNIVFIQEISFPSRAVYEALKEKNIILAGQCSCSMPEIEKLRYFDVIFTSFPHYVSKFSREYGVKTVFNALAFEPTILEKIRKYETRPYDVVFVGGVGSPSHWNYGMTVLNTIAKRIPQTKFWGYGYENLPPYSPIAGKWEGHAWGLDMYQIFAKAKIVINRHGEVADKYANNMRMFEATGCGALLVTDQKVNLSPFYFDPLEIAAYSSPDEAADAVQYFLENPDVRARVAALGQKRTLSDHTYAARMKVISDTLVPML